MVVNIQLPAEVEQRLRQQSADLESEAKQAMLIELYRQDKLSHFELSQALGLERFETDALLKKHNVTEDLPTDEEYDAALAHLGVPTNK
jgi:predicted HTH domain antitoxin